MTKFLLSHQLLKYDAYSIAPGLAMAVMGPLIMLGSVTMWYFLFGEVVNMQKSAGISLAIVGIVIASLA